MPDGDRDLVYYYSRERRSSRAQQGLHEEKLKKFGPFKVTLAGRANIMLFLSIIMICAMFALGSRITAQQSIRLGGNTIEMSIVQEEGLTLIGIAKKAPRSGEVYLGAVDITVSPAEADDGSRVFLYSIFFNPLDSETYSIPLPFAGSDFYVTLKAGEEQRSMRVNAKQ